MSGDLFSLKAASPPVANAQATVERNERNAQRDYLAATIPETEWRLQHLRHQQAASNATPAAKNLKRKRRKVPFIVHEGEGETRRIEPIGRDAWMLGKLIAVGAKGITTLECGGAPRVSGYIHKLRHIYGLAISSTEERHEGQFAGKHARYHLQQRVDFADPSDAEGL